MSIQRRRGQQAIVYKSVPRTNARGDVVIEVDMDQPITVRAAFIPQRSARAEVPGQQRINITRMIVKANLDDVDLWSRVEWDGKLWDVVTPPAHHHGTRQVRHWSIDLRERP